MDSRKTTQGDGDERTTENVVRLPRDWLGPREELVPMGSRARAAETPDDAPTESLPPTAASFWDEDSGSLQAPMQAPADAWPGQSEPASAAPAASARSRRGMRRPRVPRSLSSGFAPRRRRGTAVAAGLLTASVLVVLAVIGQTEGSTNNARDETASFAKKTPIVTATGVNRARLRANTGVVTEIKPEPTSHHAVRSPAHRRRTHVSHHSRRHTRSTTHRTAAASQPVRNTTPTYTPTPTPSTSAPASGSTSSSPPASTARSTNSSSQHQPAFGANGALGPGSSHDS